MELPTAERPRPRKSAQAFRTISEAADELNVPQHVLRFWETKFGQLQPLKRGGGRRYYRPEDLALLKRIADLLYTQGYTIKGVQRLLEEGDAPASVEEDSSLGGC
jgi:DNA-binding transcriptional MerR regulator